MKWFAHAEEFHTETTTGLIHYLTEPWVVLLIIALAVAAWWRFAVRWRMSGILAILLVAGFVTYRWSPWVSVFCISGGFALALLLTLTTLGQPAPEEPPAE